ncbi:hypothetical protein HRI_001420800 [Hibiscus trionum]|uniref:Uncharacterized protein n=1 Tax=Hibiscus trionum TaxID=183268 RepID=A0A9W7HKG0_HIBTR|nr:hypothetical protein HRI_001420800 [Hibiscus trionum]
MNSFVGTHPPPSAATRKTRRRRRPGGRGGAPSTPLHYWTLYNNNTESKKHFHFSSDAGAEDEAKFSGGGHAVELSARKLASRLWRLRSLRFGIGGFSARRKSSDRSRFKPAGMSRVDLMPSRDQSSEVHCSGTKHQLPRSQSTIVGPKQGSIHKVWVLISLDHRGR